MDQNIAESLKAVEDIDIAPAESEKEYHARFKKNVVEATKLPLFNYSYLTSPVVTTITVIANVSGICFNERTLFERIELGDRIKYVGCKYGDKFLEGYEPNSRKRRTKEIKSMMASSSTDDSEHAPVETVDTPFDIEGRINLLRNMNTINIDQVLTQNAHLYAEVNTQNVYLELATNGLKHVPAKPNKEGKSAKHKTFSGQYTMFTTADGKQGYRRFRINPQDPFDGDEPVDQAPIDRAAIKLEDGQRLPQSSNKIVKISTPVERKTKGYFLSQISITYCYDAFNSLHFKVFRTGKIQIPGVNLNNLPHAIDSTISLCRYFHMMSRDKSETPDLGVRLVTFKLHMMNFKTQIVREEGSIINLRNLCNHFKAKAASIPANAPTQVSSVIYNPAENNQLKIRFTFFNPNIDRREQLEAPVLSIFNSGKIYILGGKSYWALYQIFDVINGILEEHRHDIIINTKNRAKLMSHHIASIYKKQGALVQGEQLDKVDTRIPHSNDIGGDQDIEGHECKGQKEPLKDCAITGCHAFVGDSAREVANNTIDEDIARNNNEK